MDGRAREWQKGEREGIHFPISITVFTVELTQVATTTFEIGPDNLGDKAKK